MVAHFRARSRDTFGLYGLAAFFLLAAFSFPSPMNDRRSQVTDVVIRLASAGIFALPTLFLGWRNSRKCLLIGDSGVTFVLPSGRLLIKWSEILSVTVRIHQVEYNGFKTPYFETRLELTNDSHESLAFTCLCEGDAISAGKLIASKLSIDLKIINV